VGLRLFGFADSFVHFLLAQKTNQKRAPEMTTSNWPYARYTGLIGATGQSEVRTISGLPSHH
jgi:hypothetical protein